MKLNWKKFDYFLLFALAATVLALLWPGNIPWAGDEAQLTGLALQGNGSGVWAPHGLYGTVGVAYGALIVWLNQLLLRLTADPVLIAAVKCVLSLSISWGAIFWMSRTFRTRIGPGAALFFCSPYVYFYSRMSWDNVWLLPFGLMFAAFAAAWFLRGKIHYAAGAALFLAAMVYLHPVSFPVAPAFAAAILLFRFREFKREYWKLLLVGAGALLLLLPYFIQCARTYQRDPSKELPGFLELLPAALTTGRNLTAFDFSSRFAPETALSVMSMLVMAAIPVIAFFTVLGIITVIRRYRKNEMNAFDRTAGCGLLAILFFSAAILILRVEHQTHYNSTVTFAYLLLTWRGFCAFREDYKRYAEAALGATLLLQLGFIADFALQVKSNSGGGSEHFGTTLANQWSVARNLAAAYQANSQLKVDIQAEQQRNDPYRLQVLIALAFKNALPEAGSYSQAYLLPARHGSGLDLVLVE